MKKICLIFVTFIFIITVKAQKSPDRLIIIENNKYGYIDTLGNIIIAPQWDFAFPFSGDQARVNIGGKPNIYGSVEGGKIGFIDKQGNYVIEPLSLYAFDFREGMARVYLKGKYGFMNMNGDLVIDAIYDEAYDFNSGVACVGRNYSYVCIDKQGKQLFQKTFDNPVEFNNGLAITGLIWEKGIMNLKGEIISKEKYMEIIPMENGRYRVTNVEGLTGIIDSNMKELVPCRYTLLENYNESMAVANTGGKTSIKSPQVIGGQWMYLDMAGNVVLKAENVMMAGNFSNGLAAVMQNYLWGFMDKTGKIVIPCQFEKISNFSDGMACFVVNGKYGFIDKTGKIQVKAAYDYAEPFRNGLAIVNTGYFKDELNPELCKTGKYGAIDRTGKMIIPIEFEKLSFVSETIVKAERAGRIEYFSISGKRIYPK